MDHTHNKTTLQATDSGYNRPEPFGTVVSCTATTVQRRDESGKDTTCSIESRACSKLQ